MAATLHTERLCLRDWRDSDLAAFAELNADPEVMSYLPAVLSPIESDAFAKRIRRESSDREFGLWAVEISGGASFIGFVGLAVPRFQAHFTPCVEIGWRLARAYWGLGYASEAAEAALGHGFDVLSLAEIVSFTVPENRRSRRVMEKLGMQHVDSDDFEHPGMQPGHPLRSHVLYRLTRDVWWSVARGETRRSGG